MVLLEQGELKDEDLLAGCRRGDDFAWEALVHRYQRLVYSIPRHAGLNYDDSAEVFQEVFAALIRNLNSIDKPERLHAWLVTTARRKTSRLISKFPQLQQTRRTETEPEQISELRDDAPLPDEVLVRIEQQRRIRMGINKLDERCKQLLVALFYRPEPPSYAEVARALGIPEGSVGPTRARCLQKLLHLVEY